MSNPGERAGITPILVTLLMVGAIVGLGALMLPKPPKAPPPQPSDENADIATITGFIPTFGGVLTAAGLADLLRSPGPFTVFAPAEGAFARLPAGTLADLMKPENQAALQALMRHHIVPGKFLAADLQGKTSLQTLDGATLEVSMNGDRITVNGARLITTDMLATNGVIHVISAVLMPPE